MDNIEEFELEEYEQSNFYIDSDGMAEWAVGKIKEENAETERLIQLAELKKRELDGMIAELKAKNERRTSYLKERLREFFDYECNDKKKKTFTQESYKLLSGTLVRKFRSDKMVKDDATLVAYLESTGQNEFVKVEKRPDWAEFKKRLSIVNGKVCDRASGEVVECIGVEDVPEKFDLRF